MKTLPLRLAPSQDLRRVFGGHLVAGCTARTTAGVLIALPPGHRYAREPDPASGYSERVVCHAD